MPKLRQLAISIKNLDHIGIWMSSLIAFMVGKLPSHTKSKLTGQYNFSNQSQFISLITE